MLVEYGDQRPPKVNVKQLGIVERDLECLHSVVKCVGWFDNETVS
jgi:hypothetical protein